MDVPEVEEEELVTLEKCLAAKKGSGWQETEDLSWRHHPLPVYRGWFHHRASYEYLLSGCVPPIISGFQSSFQCSGRSTSEPEEVRQLLSSPELLSPHFLTAIGAWTDPKFTSWMSNQLHVPIRRFFLSA